MKIHCMQMTQVFSRRRELLGVMVFVLVALTRMADSATAKLSLRISARQKLFINVCCQEFFPTLACQRSRDNNVIESSAAVIGARARAKDETK